MSTRPHLVTDWGKLIGPNPTHSMQLNTEANAPAPRSVCEGIGLRTAANNQLEHIIVWTSIGLTISVSQTQFSHALLYSNYYAVFVSSVWIVLNLPYIISTISTAIGCGWVRKTISRWCRARGTWNAVHFKLCDVWRWRDVLQNWSRSAIPRGRYPHTVPSDCDIRV